MEAHKFVQSTPKCVAKLNFPATGTSEEPNRDKMSAIFIAYFLMSTAAMAEARGSYFTAFNVLGDSSVDCGENTLFYPFLHRNLSLVPCDGSDSSLLPHLLGISSINTLVLVFSGYLLRTEID